MWVESWIDREVKEVMECLSAEQRVRGMYYGLITQELQRDSGMVE